MALVEPNAIEIINEPRTDDHEDAMIDGDEEAEIDDKDDDEIDGDSDSDVESVIDFEGDVHGKPRVDYIDYESETDELKRQIVCFHYQWERSEGFEVDWSQFTYGFRCCPVVWKEKLLLTGERSDKVVKKLTIYAIDKYNRDEGRKLELVKILKANYHMANGQVLFITFSARDLSSSDSEPSLYQTNVWKCRQEIEVLLFRPRPSDKEIASVEVNPPGFMFFHGKSPEFYVEPGKIF